jgi:hypothetical protein
MNRGRTIGRAITLLATVAMAAGTLPTSLQARAAGPTSLGVTSFGRILVDAATSHVFVSSPASSSIVVLDYTGTIVKTITGEAGAYGMALSGSTLYVALSTGGAIEKIDTGTLLDAGQLVNGIVHPTDLVLAGSKLWTTTGNCANWTVQLVSVDPAAVTPTVTAYPSAFDSTNSLSYCAAFASSPNSNPNLLLAWDLGLSPANITSFDVSSGSPVQVATARESNLGNLQDVAVTPDGTHFITASGSPYEFDEWAVAGLGQDGVIYPANTYPTAVATVGANGNVMAGGLNGIYDFDFYAYKIGAPATTLAKVDFGGTSNTVPSRGVALQSNGLNAFVVSGGTGTFLLNIVPIAVTGQPGPPTGATATAGAGSATVSWTPPADPGTSPITSYTVTSSPGGVTASTAGTSTTVTGLTPGVSYTFTVTATNTAGTGPPSAPSNAVVPTTTPGAPQPPTGATATAGIGSASVSWTPPVDPGTSPITSYTVTSSPGGITATTSGTSTVVNGLTPGVSYTFTVTATNTSGPSAASAASNPVVPWACSPPTSVSAIAGDTDAYVAWTAPATIVGTLTGYRVTPYVGTTAQSPTAVTGTPPATNVIVTGLTNQTIYTFVIACTVNGALGQDSAPSNAVTPVQGGNYHPLTPARILDTRSAIGGPTQPMQNLESRGVQITGVGGVPSSGVSAVVLNVTITGTNSAGYLTVYPSGVTRPTASNLNFVAGETVPNLVEVAVGYAGQVTMFTQFASTAGSADVIFDVAGWVGVAGNSLTKDGLYQPLTPARIMDTRTGLGVAQAAVGPGQTVTLNVFAPGGVPSGAGVSAVVLNVTVTGPSTASYLTVFPADAPQRPTASNLNFSARQTVPNRVIVKVGAGGLVSFYNAAGSTQVIADIGGWFTDATSTAGGARFSGTIPTRMLDTRTPGIGPIYGGALNTFQLLDQNNQPVTGVSAVVFNVTVTNTSASSYVTLWPAGPPRPTVSDLNFTAGETVPNLVVVKLGTNATIDIYNAVGQTDLIMDMVGYYGGAVPAPARPIKSFSLHLSRIRP